MVLLLIIADHFYVLPYLEKINMALILSIVYIRASCGQLAAAQWRSSR